jgi:hypothetical protein
MDTGTSCGEIAGHSKVRIVHFRKFIVHKSLSLKVINAVSIRQQRPFRAVTAADDSTIIFYHGIVFAAHSIRRGDSLYYSRRALQI